MRSVILIGLKGDLAPCYAIFSLLQNHWVDFLALNVLKVAFVYGLVTDSLVRLHFLLLDDFHHLFFLSLGNQFSTDPDFLFLVRIDIVVLQLVPVVNRLAASVFLAVHEVLLRLSQSSPLEAHPTLAWLNSLVFIWNALIQIEVKITTVVWGIWTSILHVVVVG